MTRRARHRSSLAMTLAASLVVGACGAGVDGPAPLRLVLDDPTDAPMRGLSADEQAGFDRGDALFARQYLPTQGLGPVFVRASCASCHARDGRGPGFVERAIAVGADGYTPAPDQSVMPFGPVVRPYFVAPATRGVEAPAEGTPGLLRSVRVGPAVFGRGWIEAVDESCLLYTSPSPRDRTRSRMPSSA